MAWKGFGRLWRWFRARPVAAAAALYALLAVVFLAPGLLPGHTISGSDYLWTAAPWNTSRPPDVHRFGANGELVDPVTVFQPFLQYTRSALPDVPLWNPHLMAGRPFVANEQSAVFSPFSLPSYVFGFWWSLSLVAALKLFVAAFGTFLLGRALGMRFAGALLAGVVFGFCLYFVVWLPWPLTSIWALLPWLLWLTDRLVRRPDLLSGAGLTAVVGLQFLGGHPESSFHVLVATVAFFALRAWQARRDGVARPAIVFAAALAGGTALAALTILPFLELVNHSGDLAKRAGQAPGAIQRRYIFAALVPDYWGRPTQTTLAGFEVERAFYAGVLPLLLAAAALVLRPRLERVAVAAFGALCMAVVLGVPPVFRLVTALPGFNSIYNTRLSIVAMLCVALLAGWGLDELVERRQRRRATALLAGAAVLLVVPVVVVVADGRTSLSFLGDALRVASGFGHPPPQLSLTGVPVVRLAALIEWIAIAGAAVALLAARVRWRLAAGTFAALAVCLSYVDLVRAGMGQNPALTVAQARQPVTGAIRYLQARRPARFVGVLPGSGASPIPPDVAMRYGLYDARSYDYPVERRYDRLWGRAVGPRFSLQPAITTPVIDARSMAVLSLLGVADVITQRGEPRLGAPGLRVAYDGPDARIYANDRALPRAWVVSGQRVVSGEEAALRAVADGGVVLGRTVVTERPLPGLTVGGTGPAATGAARIVSYGRQHVVLAATATRPGELVLSDLSYPGWRATVDGHGVPLHRVDYLLRGVSLPAGAHRVEMTYEPASWRAGWIVSALALAALAAAAVVGVRRRRAA